MSTLVNYYNASAINPFIMVLLTWIIWPGIMFIVGAIGESRLVPIGESQSKAFMPGDLAFGVIFVTLIGLYHQNEAFNYRLCILLFVPVLYFAWLMRRDDVRHYPPRARISPTKITHDFIGYFVVPLVLLTLSISKIKDIVQYREHLITELPNWLIVLSALLFYIICVFIDKEQPATPKQIKARHPADWKPIWKTTKNPR